MNYSKYIEGTPKFTYEENLDEHKKYVFLIHPHGGVIGSFWANRFRFELAQKRIFAHDVMHVDAFNNTILHTSSYYLAPKFDLLSQNRECLFLISLSGHGFGTNTSKSPCSGRQGYCLSTYAYINGV